MPRWPAEPAVHLDATVAPPTYLNTHSRDEIDQLAGRPVTVQGMKHAGLTRSRTDFRIQPHFLVTRREGGPSCMTLRSVAADWRVSAVTVDIASEYAPGGCAYREVRAHENEHVAIIRRTFAEFMPRLKARLKQASAEVEPITTDRPDAAAKKVLDELSAAARQVLDEFHAELERRNGVIDTPQNYEAVSARCTHW